MPLRLGLAGLGVHGERYARHLLAGDVPGVELVAVSRRDDRSGRAFAERHGVRFVGDAADLADHDGVDAVILVLPPDRHAPIACACLERGRPVLVEKPLAIDVASALRVRAMVARSGTPLMVAQTLRFDPMIAALKHEMRSIGPLRLISINQRFEPAGRAWLDTEGPGGILLNTGIHGFDLIRHITGREVVSVRALSGRFETKRTDDQFVAAFELEGGVLGLIDNVRTTRSRSGRIELVGREGQVWGDHIHRTLVRVHGRETTDLGPVPGQPTIPVAIDAFARAARGEIAPPIDVDDGVASVALVVAAEESARSGNAVRPTQG